MRTREEQIAELVDALKKPVCRPDYSVNILKMWLETHIREAEERARAECAADTRRIDTIEKLIAETVSVEFVGHFNKPETSLSTLSGVRIDGETGILPNIRAAIDAAMEGGK